MAQTIDSYKIATEIRNLEIKLFWQRSNYFLVLNTAAATGTLLKIDCPAIAFPLSLFGVAISLMWISINLGSKYWQDRWERKIAKLEIQEDPTLELFAVSREIIDQEVKESLRYDTTRWYHWWRILVNYLVMFKPSVSRTMVLLSFVFFFSWVGAAYSSTNHFLATNSPKSVIDSTSITICDSLSNRYPADSLCHNITHVDSMPIKWQIIFQFAAVVFGILLSFWINRKIESNKKLRANKSLILLIGQEVEQNIKLLEQIINEAKQKVVPYYQLATEDKEACWHSLVEFPIAERELINQISKSYFEYRLINRTLDMIFFKEGIQSRVFSHSTIPLCKAELERSKTLLRKLKVWANR